MGERARTDVETISPDAWRLLRVAADFSQRDVEREIDEVMQAHISMLENGTRALSVERRRQLLDLYVAELAPEQVDALVEHF